ncbi:prolidase family protein [Geotalea daltonii FRC-32]|uniref:Prolidase family protein n=1 Tax=Geotalea daltonii (strain DSM 22248 / JCM 15807 / FRC-32) TaxID=316067 RepID=B9M3I0_GEODF|nr:Xaa-Pro peptidase family protein [Geotalea daltonii]ACM21401.1 prolidase family protein [Geotalea daltonii FRC-32]
MLKDRIFSAQRHLKLLDVDILIFFGLSTIRYLTGFTGSSGVLILGQEDCWFLTDSRYTTQASAEISGCSIIEYRSQIDGISSLVKGIPARRIAFDAEHTTVALFNELSKALPDVRLVPAGKEVELLRAVKDADEINILAASAEIASNALLEMISLIKPGVTEHEIALALEFAMKNAGAEEKAFDFIVASGTRGALPHGKASDKAIAAGELVTIDFGAVYKGYFSDETVTFAVGRTDARQEQIYSIVKDAHDLAMAAVKPGITFKALDALARDYITEAGFGSNFGHGLGHGVGLEVHESPTVSFRNDGVVEEGMVFTIEPGIYIPGWGGVRIEDTVAVTVDGCDVLTKVPKVLQVV